MRLKIQGLVKMMNNVRDRLKASLTQMQADELSRQVRRNLDAVRKLCRRHLSSPRNLPMPSRRAFEYLDSLKIEASLDSDMDTNERESHASGSSIKIKGLGSIVESFLNQMALSWDQEKIAAFKKQAGYYLTKTLDLLKRRRSGITDLSVKQQRLLVRLELYMDDAIMEIIPKNVRCFIEAFNRHWENHSSKDQPRIIFISTNNTLWRYREDKKGLVIKISDLFFLKDDPPFLEKFAETLVKKITGRRVSIKEIRQWLTNDDVLLFQKRIEEAVHHKKNSARGLVYDLDLIFEKLNKKYFDNKLSASGLSWTMNVAKSRTGYYYPLSNEIFISTALDDKKVPLYVVEFVLYHEMLHMEDGIDSIKPGKKIHNLSFKKREKKFKYYDKAEAFLRRLAMSK
ncbi:MAG: hypothetical protein KAS64_07690 [Spirochaetes bacterium]|nr:hypothetical protein [Spirochaetota bacterium]